MADIEIVKALINFKLKAAYNGEVVNDKIDSAKLVNVRDYTKKFKKLKINGWKFKIRIISHPSWDCERMCIVVYAYNASSVNEETRIIFPTKDADKYSTKEIKTNCAGCYIIHSISNEESTINNQQYTLFDSKAPPETSIEFYAPETIHELKGWKFTLDYNIRCCMSCLVEGDSPEGPPEFEERVVPHPSITIKKEVDRTEVIGEEDVKFTYTVTNTGDCDLTDVIVEDDILGIIIPNEEPPGESDEDLTEEEQKIKIETEKEAEEKRLSGKFDLPITEGENSKTLTITAPVNKTQTNKAIVTGHFQDIIVTAADKATVKYIEPKYELCIEAIPAETSATYNIKTKITHQICNSGNMALDYLTMYNHLGLMEHNIIERSNNENLIGFEVGSVILNPGECIEFDTVVTTTELNQTEEEDCMGEISTFCCYPFRVEANCNPGLENTRCNVGTPTISTEVKRCIVLKEADFEVTKTATLSYNEPNIYVTFSLTVKNTSDLIIEEINITDEPRQYCTSTETCTTTTSEETIPDNEDIGFFIEDDEENANQLSLYLDPEDYNQETGTITLPQILNLKPGEEETISYTFIYPPCYCCPDNAEELCGKVFVKNTATVNAIKIFKRINKFIVNCIKKEEEVTVKKRLDPLVAESSTEVKIPRETWASADDLMEFQTVYRKRDEIVSLFPVSDEWVRNQVMTFKKKIPLIGPIDPIDGSLGSLDRRKWKLPKGLNFADGVNFNKKFDPGDVVIYSENTCEDTCNPECKNILPVSCIDSCYVTLCDDAPPCECVFIDAWVWNVEGISYEYLGTLSSFYAAWSVMEQIKIESFNYDDDVARLRERIRFDAFRSRFLSLLQGLHVTPKLGAVEAESLNYGKWKKKN